MTVVIFRFAPPAGSPPGGLPAFLFTTQSKAGFAFTRAILWIEMGVGEMRVGGAGESYDDVGLEYELVVDRLKQLWMI